MDYVGIDLHKQGGAWMPTERLLMRQLREILRLRWACSLPQRAVARACGVGLATASEYCRRA